MEMQTDVYLEEITDRVPELDNETQTDPFLDRPPSPHFVPTKLASTKRHRFTMAICLISISKSILFLEVWLADARAIDDGSARGRKIGVYACSSAKFEQLRNADWLNAAHGGRRSAVLMKEPQGKERARAEGTTSERKIGRSRLCASLARFAAVSVWFAAISWVCRLFCCYILSLSCLFWFLYLYPLRFVSNFSRSYFYDHVQREVETQVMPWLLAVLSSKSTAGHCTPTCRPYVLITI